MNILGYMQNSFQDCEKGLSSVIFTGGCNFNCPACYSKKLIRNNQNEPYSSNEIIDAILEKKNYVNKIVICGGEPTLQQGLLKFTKKLKDNNFFVKLDTNGSNPNILQYLLDQKTIDYVAMDVKGPRSLYSIITGIKNLNIKNIEESMKIIQKFPDHEFRTTIVPILYGNRTNFMCVEEIIETAKEIADITGKNNHKYYLQKFIPKKDELLDSRLEKFSETPRDLLEKMKLRTIEYLPNCKIR